MKFTSSPWGFRFWDFERYCDFMKEIGIKEICSMFMFKGGEKFNLLFKRDKEDIEKFKEIAEGKGIRFIEVSITDRWKEEIPLAKILDVKYLRVCSMWEDTKDMFKKVVFEIKEIGKMAENYGMEVVVENHGGLMTRAEKCKELIEAVGLSNVKINYDPANFLYYGEDPIKAIDYIFPYIGFTHFKSVKYENGKPKYCRLKEGVIDYKRVFERLLPSYTGYIGLEYEEPSDVEEGTIDDFDYLKNILGRR